MPSKHEEALQKVMEENHLETAKRQIQAEKNKAQSVSIGSCGGGALELVMRGVGGSYLFNVYQPVEAIELINQLAAAVGCHIHIQPRKDFASWREWDEVSEEQRNHLGASPPFSAHNSNLTQSGKGITCIRQKKRQLEHLGSIEEEILSSISGKKTQEVLEQINAKKNVAAKKPIRRKSSKRASTTSK